MPAVTGAALPSLSQIFGWDTEHLSRAATDWSTTNLPFHHDVGSGGKAFAPFDTGGWNTKYDVPAPLPATTFGSPDNPPSAVPPPSTVGVPS